MQKILIIDTDTVLLKLLETLMRKYFEVIATSNVCAVFKLIRTFKPSVVIVNAFLGAFDGRNICREIKRHGSSGNVQLLLLVDKELQHYASQYECDEIIEKPFTSFFLLEKILPLTSGV